jgi:hypothetical protein
VLTAGALACARPEPAPQASPYERNRRAAQELLPFEASFSAIVQALEGGDDELAGQILERAMARGPQGAALERALAFGRILAGRRLVRALDLRLACEPQAEGRAVEVAFLARHGLEEALTLRTGPASLAVLLVAVERDGDEQRFASSRVHDELGLLDLEPGTEQRFALGAFDVPGGPDALAVRASFELRFIPGEILTADAGLPAQNVHVAPVEFVRLASWVPSAPVEPAELSSYVAGEGGQDFTLAGALERAVRVESRRRAEALDLLAPLVAHMSARVDLPRLAPTLRWLSGNPSLGRDGDGWKAWMAAWQRDRAAARQGRVLELPTRVSGGQGAGQP